MAHSRQHDVLLRVARRGAAQIALHHVLIESGHGHQQDDTRGEHFPEIAARSGIVEEENARHGRSGNLAGRIGERETQPPHDEDDRQHEARHEAESLERIGPDQRLDAALPGVEPDEKHRDEGVAPEREAVVRKDQQLHHGTDHIDAQRGAQHLRNEEKPRPGAV